MLFFDQPASAAIFYGHPVELDNANGHLVTGIHIHAATVSHREVIPTAVAEVRTAEKSMSKHGCFVCSMGGTGSKQVFHGTTAVLILPTEVSHDGKHRSNVAGYSRLPARRSRYYHPSA